MSPIAPSALRRRSEAIGALSAMALSILTAAGTPTCPMQLLATLASGWSPLATCTSVSRILGRQLSSQARRVSSRGVAKATPGAARRSGWRSGRASCFWRRTG